MSKTQWAQNFFTTTPDPDRLSETNGKAVVAVCGGCGKVYHWGNGWASGVTTAIRHLSAAHGMQPPAPPAAAGQCVGAVAQLAPAATGPFTSSPHPVVSSVMSPPPSASAPSTWPPGQTSSRKKTASGPARSGTKGQKAKLPDPMSFGAHTSSSDIPLGLVDSFVEMVQQDADLHRLKHGVLMLRKILAVASTPPSKLVIDTGVCPRLVELLDREDDPQLQFEACWALCNIAAGTSQETQYILSLGSAPRFVKLAYSSDMNCAEQAVWGIGNIAGDGPVLRDTMIHAGAIDCCLDLLKKEGLAANVAENTAWALSNCLRSLPPPPFDVTAPALPVMFDWLSRGGVPETLVADLLWGLSYISEGTAEGTRALINELAGGKQLQAWLNSGCTGVENPALRLLGNLVLHGCDHDTRRLLGNGELLDTFHRFVHHPKNAVRKEVYWTISNIATNTEFVQMILDHNLWEPLMTVPRQALSADSRKELLYAVSNVLEFADVPLLNTKVPGSVEAVGRDCLEALETYPRYQTEIGDLLLLLLAKGEELAEGDTKDGNPFNEVLHTAFFDKGKKTKLIKEKETLLGTLDPTIRQPLQMYLEGPVVRTKHLLHWAIDSPVPLPHDLIDRLVEFVGPNDVLEEFDLFDPSADDVSLSDKAYREHIVDGSGV